MKPLGCKTFETKEMRLDEIVTYIEAAVENGTDLDTAYEDMKMLDNMFAMKRSHIVSVGFMGLTWKGNIRKNRTLSDCYEAILNGRISETENI